MFLQILSVAAVLSATVKASQFPVEASSLFKSNARNFFESDQQLLEDFSSFDQKHSHVASQDLNLFSHYIIKLDESCDRSCHSKIWSEVSKPENYHILDDSHGIIHCSSSELAALKAKHSIISESLHMNPQFKVESDIRSQITSQCESAVAAALSTVSNGLLRKRSLPEDIITQSPVRIRVIVSPMQDLQAVDSFLSYLSTLSTASEDVKPDLSFIAREGNKLTFLKRQTVIPVDITATCDDALQLVLQIAARPEVFWVERDYPVEVHNRWARGVCDSGDYTSTPLIHTGITGKGHIVGIADTGIDMYNCYFHDVNVDLVIQQTATAAGLVTNPNHRKVIQYVNYAGNYKDDDTGHGSHVSGSVAGFCLDNTTRTDGVLQNAYNGMAYDAKIAFFDMGTTNSAGDTSLTPPNNIETDLLETLYASGARIFTNSWGTSSNGYDSLAQGVDQFMWDYPDAFVLFSAGNNGEDGRNTVSSPSTNKNGASVGASLNDYESWKALYGGSSVDHDHKKEALAYFSSRGPTFDNRQKPDFLAPGWWVTSALSKSTSTEPFCDTQGLSGTSMATPISAGYAVKVRQYFMDGYYPSGAKTSANAFTPSGALIKATLVHSSQEMSLVVNEDGSSDSISLYPNVDQGYGRIEMDKVLNFGTSSTSPISMFVIGDIDTSSSKYAEITASALSQTFTFTTNSDATQSPVRITMCYTDYPGNVQTGIVMVNTLNLQVVDDDGVSTSPYLTDGTTVSNTQVIDIPVVKASTTYTVTVSATAVAQSQPFALVITGDITYLPYSYDYSETQSSKNKTPGFGSANWRYFVIAVGILIVLCVLISCFRCCANRASSSHQQHEHHAVTHNAHAAPANHEHVHVQMVEA